MEPLLFTNPIFHKGLNLTVRRGEKWKDKIGDVVIEDTNNPDYKIDGKIILTEPKTLNLLEKEPHKLLKLEHDPSCRNVDGLRKELKRVYGDIDDNERLTLVWFEVS